jgi:hypothetical protein
MTLEERPTLAQALARFERRKKYASMAHELRQGQQRRHLYNDLQRVEGVLYHRLREGMRDHAQFAVQKEKLQRAIRETTFD